MRRNLHKNHYHLTSTFIIILLLFAQVIGVNAKGIVVEYDQPRVGVVIDVIDGEAVKVLYLSTLKTVPEVETIKLIGVDSMANDETFNYMRHQMLGKVVFVLKEEGLPEIPGFTNGYIYLTTDMSMSEVLLKEGRVALDETFENASQYSDLVSTSSYAKRHELGIYELSDSPRNYININTASHALLVEHLDISDEAANGIISMRTYNPINDTRELGFTHEEIDKEFILNHYKTIHFMTNINDASVYELGSLINSDKFEQIAFDINQYLIFNPFQTVEDIKKIPSAKNFYYLVKDFITMDYNDNIYSESTTHRKVNINTASATEISQLTGFNITTAASIVYLREENNYSFKSLSELMKPGYPLNGFDMNVLMDDLTVYTEINEATTYELTSLFSGSELPVQKVQTFVSLLQTYRPFYNQMQIELLLGETVYNDIASYILVDGQRDALIDAPININTNTDERVFEHLNLPLDYQLRYDAHVYKYYDPEDLDFNRKEDRDSFSLYTDINGASYEELMLMHTNMTTYIANKIIEYRSDYPFYTLEEVKEFFTDMKYLYIYNDIQDFIVFY